MRVLALAAFAVALTAAPAAAQCAGVPGAAPWQGAAEATTRALCLQRELSEATRDVAREVRWRTDLGVLAARNQLLLQQLRAAAMLNN